MSQSHRRVNSAGSVAFSWEDRPGVSKMGHGEAQGRPTSSSSATAATDESPEAGLPPPPCLDDNSPRREVAAGRHSIHVPLPPCPFQPSTSTRYLSRGEDPFLAAYMECTKSGSGGRRKEVKKASGGLGLRLGAWFGLGMFSCKQGSGVREDGICLKVSQVASWHARDGHDHHSDDRLLLERSKSQGSFRVIKQKKLRN